jgi:hypothetical protein
MLRIRSALVPLVIGIAVLACDSSTHIARPRVARGPATAVACQRRQARRPPRRIGRAAQRAALAPGGGRRRRAAFTDVVTDPLFTATIDIDGSATVSRVDTTIAGTLEVSSGSRHLVVTSKTGSPRRRWRPCRPATTGTA